MAQAEGMRVQRYHEKRNRELQIGLMPDSRVCIQQRGKFGAG